MKVLILAAGYGTRLSRDLESQRDEYPHLVGVAKPLLPVAGQPLISHWMDTLRACPETQSEDVYVVVNAANIDQFRKWSESYPNIKLVSDGSTCNEERVGAVGCIQLAVEHFNVQDDLIVIGGDTLFFEDFDLSEFVGLLKTLPVRESEGALVTCYNCKDEETVKFGILEVDKSGKITSFLEKPQQDATPSRKACPCFYLFSKGSLPLLKEFLRDKKDAPLRERDATGNFIKYLSTRRAVYTKLISGRFDVGGLQSYLECCRLFKPKF